MPSHRRQVYSSQPRDVVRATGKEEKAEQCYYLESLLKMGIKVRSVQREPCTGPVHLKWSSGMSPQHKHPSLHWAEGGTVTSEAHLLSSPASTMLCGSFSCPADLSYTPELLIRISIATVYSHLGLPLAEHPALTESTMGLPAAFQSNNNHKLQQIPEVQKENKIPNVTNRKKKILQITTFFCLPYSVLLI